MKRQAPSNDNIRQSAGAAMAEIAGYYERGELEAAESLCRAVLDQFPEDPDLHNMMGAILMKRRAYQAAIPCFRQAIVFVPKKVSYYNNLAAALRRAGRPAEAVPVLKKAMQIAPDNPEVYLGLGHTATRLDNLEDARSCYEQALALSPNHAVAWFHLGNTLVSLGKHENGLHAYEQAIKLDPKDPRALYNHSLCALTLGRFAEGFNNYELRWVQPEMPTLPIALAGKTMWDGKPLKGTLLVIKEQGLGDAIQCLRFLPEIKKRVDKLVVQLPESLHGLARRMDVADEIISPEAPLPECESFIPLMSLPRVLEISEKTLPGKIPYLTVDEKRKVQWKQKLTSKGKKVGIFWRGAPKHSNDKNRSMRLEMLAPLFDVPGVTFYSLQKGTGEEELEAFKDKKNLVALGADIKDYDDTAAILEQLDVLISVDTSVIHLAGALNVPCWAMIPLRPDWRWLLERKDTMWYPSLTLFRQKEVGKWEPVIDAIKKALAKL